MSKKANKSQETEEQTIEFVRKDESNQSSGKSIIIWFLLFICIVSAGGFYGYKFLLNRNLEIVEPETKPKSKIEQPAPTKQIIEPEKANNFDMEFGAEPSKDIAISEEAKKPEPAEKVDESKRLEEPELAQPNPVETEKFIDIEKKLASISEQNKQLALLVATQNLRAEIEGRGNLDIAKTELNFIKKIAGESPEFKAKIDLIEYAFEGGFENEQELIQGLKKVAKATENPKQKTFWENLSDSVFGLIKITKLDEEGADDYAKLLIAKQKIEAGNFESAIRLVELVNHPKAKAWTEKAYKLQRVIESLDYIETRLRKNLVENDA